MVDWVSGKRQSGLVRPFAAAVVWWLQAPARDGLRGVVSRRAVKHGLIVTPGKRERARREALAQRRRRLIAAIREPSLKSGVITVGSGFGGTGKTDVAVTLAAIYAAARPADRVILADSNDDMPHGYIRLGGRPVEELPQQQRPLSLRGFIRRAGTAASAFMRTCAMPLRGCRGWR
jgi:hypothetical protein